MLSRERNTPDLRTLSLFCFSSPPSRNIVSSNSVQWYTKRLPFDFPRHKKRPVSFACIDYRYGRNILQQAVWYGKSYVCVCVCVRACVRVCVCVRERGCVCERESGERVCVCLRGRERVFERERVCVCARAPACLSVCLCDTNGGGGKRGSGRASKDESNVVKKKNI